MLDKKVSRQKTLRKKKKTLSFNEYKRSLELATEGMVEILDIERLIRLIVYMVVKKARLIHAGLLLYNAEKKSYILSSSRGLRGSVIPKEYIRIQPGEPIIKFFQARRGYLLNKSGAIRVEDLNRFLRNKRLFKKDKPLRELMLEVKDEMVNYEAAAFVPGYFQTKNLLGVLFLGEKNNGEKFKQEELDFFMALARTAVMAIRSAQLYKNIQKIFYGVIKAMALSIEKFDPAFTRPHMDRMFKMGSRMINKLEKRKVELPDMPKELFISSIFLHDIGKQYTPREILHKEGSLTKEEWDMLKRHPIDGAEIFEQIEGLEEVARIIRYHQEKYDGTGYPDGLKAGAIPLGARIAAVLDAFDAMTNSRPYRKKPFSIKDAVKELIKEKGRQFDPELVDVFAEVLLEEGMISFSELKEIYPDISLGFLFDSLISR
ncbi:MAG: HD domain-containing phosphohydrolase [Candidatus Omnitrophota bacterium]